MGRRQVVGNRRVKREYCYECGEEVVREESERICVWDDQARRKVPAVAHADREACRELFRRIRGVR